MNNIIQTFRMTKNIVILKPVEFYLSQVESLVKNNPNSNDDISVLVLSIAGQANDVYKSKEYQHSLVQ